MDKIKSREVKVIMDRERVLRWDLEAQYYLTCQYDTIGEAVQLMAKATDPMTANRASMDALFHFFTGMLKTDDPEITVEQTRKLLCQCDMNLMTVAVQEAMNAASPE